MFLVILGFRGDETLTPSPRGIHAQIDGSGNSRVSVECINMALLPLSEMVSTPLHCALTASATTAQSLIKRFGHYLFPPWDTL
jgi:hypothetical protein